MSTDIPATVYVALLGRTIEIHWAYHAMLMSTVWFFLVPIAIIAIRFFKPAPTSYGIERGTGRFDRKLLWWTIHYGVLYLAIGCSLLGLAIAVYVSGGISHSAHATWGFATIAFGTLQIVFAWFRGTHGGKHGVNSDPADPATWHGDHFDMTRRRRWFEAYHKTAGYFAIALAFGAAGSGLVRYWLPGVAVALAIMIFAALVASVLLEGRGFRHDTYRSVYGNHPDHPYNRARRDL